VVIEIDIQQPGPASIDGTAGIQTRRKESEMKTAHDIPTSTERSYADPTEAHRIRDLLTRAGLTQKAAALELGVDVSTVQQWYVERPKPPRMAILALERLIELQRTLRD
jgi:DNA-binding transcriptional regulator YiaG